MGLTYVGLSENMVPLNPLVYHHVPIETAIWGVYPIQRHSYMEVSIHGGTPKWLLYHGKAR